MPTPNDIEKAMIEKKVIEIKVKEIWRPLNYAIMFSNVCERCRNNTIRIKK